MTSPSNPNSAAAQRARILEQLRRGPLSTLAARAELDVLHPAARIMELREEGYCIETLRTLEHSACGRPHRVARYVLVLNEGSQPLGLHLRQASASTWPAAR